MFHESIGGLERLHGSCPDLISIRNLNRRQRRLHFEIGAADQKIEPGGPQGHLPVDLITARNDIVQLVRLKEKLDKAVGEDLVDSDPALVRIIRIIR